MIDYPQFHTRRLSSGRFCCHDLFAKYCKPGIIPTKDWIQYVSISPTYFIKLALSMSTNSEVELRGVKNYNSQTSSWDQVR